MQQLHSNDREAELSYAYIHAVASSIGGSCKYTNRADDGRGVDAVITVWPENPVGLIEIDIKIQLKATVQTKKPIDGYIPFFFSGINQYNDLRTTLLTNQRLLVVLFLPKKENDWLTISEENLTLKNCAYWVSLRGAPASKNASGQTVYIPEGNVFNKESLAAISSSLSAGKFLDYDYDV